MVSVIQNKCLMSLQWTCTWVKKGWPTFPWSVKIYFPRPVSSNQLSFSHEPRMMCVETGCLIINLFACMNNRSFQCSHYPFGLSLPIGCCSFSRVFPCHGAVASLNEHIGFWKEKETRRGNFRSELPLYVKLALECLQAHLEMYAIKNLCLYCATGYVFISSLSLHKLYLVFFSTVEYPSVILFLFHEFWCC
jgi:hypothetical protein